MVEKIEEKKILEYMKILCIVCDYRVIVKE